MESYLNQNFDVKAKHSSEEVLEKWRNLCGVVKNPKRRFRFTANLSKRYEAAAAGAQTLRKLGQLLGLFRKLAQPQAFESKSTGLADDLMQLIIQLRADSRKRKDFATADAIRDGLNKLKITLEDRPTGTGWRKD